MPYRRDGNVVEKKENDKWVKKQTCKNAKNAQKTLNLLRAKEHGWEQTGEKDD